MFLLLYSLIFVLSFLLLAFLSLGYLDIDSLLHFLTRFFFLLPFSLLHTQSNLTNIPRSEYVPGIGLGIAKCPYDPQDNSTAIYVEHGNPGGLPALVSCFSFLFFQFSFFLLFFSCFNRNEQELVKGEMKRK